MNAYADDLRYYEELEYLASTIENRLDVLAKQHHYAGFKAMLVDSSDEALSSAAREFGKYDRFVKEIRAVFRRMVQLYQRHQSRKFNVGQIMTVSGRFRHELPKDAVNLVNEYLGNGVMPRMSRKPENIVKIEKEIVKYLMGEQVTIEGIAM